MKWRELIDDIYSARPAPVGIAFKPGYHLPATSSMIAGLETALTAKLPASLRSLLLETNGIMEMMSIERGEWFESMRVIWQTFETQENNRKREAALAEQGKKNDANRFVSFASAGTDGIEFVFPVSNGVCSPIVMAWHPLRNQITELAPSLELFLRGWLLGEITV